MLHFKFLIIGEIDSANYERNCIKPSLPIEGKVAHAKII